MTKNLIFFIKKYLKLKRKVDKLEILIREASFNDIISREEFLKKYNLNTKTFDKYRKAGLVVYQPVRNGKIFVSLKEFEKFLKKK